MLMPLSVAMPLPMAMLLLDACCRWVLVARVAAGYCSCYGRRCDPFDFVCYGMAPG
jgi:hypothetical protein